MDRVRSIAVPVSIVAVQAALLGSLAPVHAPTFDEIAHLPAGVSHWRSCAFDLYRVNPPSPRMVGALPVMLAGAETESVATSADPHGRPEFAVGANFTQANGARSLWLFTLARCACIPLVLVGGWVCYRWACALAGGGAGLVALVLWTFCPTVLGWGATITPDAAAASMGVLAGYTFWRWLEAPDWRRALMAGGALGLAELTKSTWIILFGLWPVLWIATRMIARSPDVAPATKSREAGQLAVILLAAVYLLNLGYGFEESFQPLG
jgi:hypothetical protein